MSRVVVPKMRDEFIHEDFLLGSEPARRLYHEYARHLPIVDFHSHLSPEQIATDHCFRNLTELWLDDDRAKWRVMRAHGIDERYCTGTASDYEKFVKWAETVPHLLRSPLYHWSHMELARAFGLSDRLLGPDTAPDIWNECNKLLARPDYSARHLLHRANVVLVCTTDDPVDTLEHHHALANDPTASLRMLPTWRPDAALAVDDPADFNAWVDALSAAANADIHNLATYFAALANRHAYFHAHGCRLSDHGLEALHAEDYTLAEIETIFARLRSGQSIGPRECAQFKSALLYELALLDHARGWTQQFHLGALRDCNTRRVAQLGVDMGFDSIGDFTQARPLAKFLDRLDHTDQLARTILYNLNPRDNALLTTMIGNFPDARVPAKLQHGAAWWFNDHVDGITQQIDALAQVGVLSRFVGMVTDSRSFLSYTRHEYFRRILCNVLGTDIARGRVPADFDLAGGFVRDICYNNAVTYLGFDLPHALAQSKPTRASAHPVAAGE